MKHLLQTSLIEEEMSLAVKLRYHAYRNVGAIDENSLAEFRDRYDLLPNSRTCLIYEEDAIPVASVRACIYDLKDNSFEIPALEVYKEDIEKEIGLDKKIIESNRFVIHPDKVDSKQLFKVPFRFILLNAIKFESEYIIAAVRAKHVPLYQRFLGLEPISSPKTYPGINVKMIMMAGQCDDLIPKLMAKEELFRITEDEVNHYLAESNEYQLLNA